MLEYMQMKVAIIAMVSADGRLTRGTETNIHAWRSPEEGAMFTKLLGQHEVVIVGRKGYEAAGRPKPREGRLYAVMTRHPERFKELTVPDRLEFMDDSPHDLMQNLQKRGYHSAAITTGGDLNNDFLAAGVVDELYLTIEPYMFGAGGDLAGTKALNVSLTLLDVQQLNDRGTLLAHYKLGR